MKHFFDVNAIQPVTPLFAIYQLAKIARADEIIAKRRRECRGASGEQSREKLLRFARRRTGTDTAEQRPGRFKLNG